MGCSRVGTFHRNASIKMISNLGAMFDGGCESEESSKDFCCLELPFQTWKQRPDELVLLFHAAMASPRSTS
jgi:hypothetical protein